MGLAPQSATWTAAWPQHFSSFPLFSLPPPTSSPLVFSSSLCVCAREGERDSSGEESKREHLCWPTCFQCHFHGAICFSSLVSAFSSVLSFSLSLPFGPSLLCRHIKWHGRSWSQWTQTTPRTTTGLSRNQWVSGAVGCESFVRKTHTKAIVKTDYKVSNSVFARCCIYSTQELASSPFWVSSYSGPKSFLCSSCHWVPAFVHILSILNVLTFLDSPGIFCIISEPLGKPYFPTVSLW